MTDKDEQRLFEIYKLHTELAERVAGLREDLQKIYASVVTSILAASVIAHRASPDTRELWVLPAVGMLLCIVWRYSLRSVSGRLAAKQAVLKEVESSLGLTFLKEEREEFERQESPRRRRTARWLPWTFFWVCLGWLVLLVGVSVFGNG